jgi:hypothetical protein
MRAAILANLARAGRRRGALAIDASDGRLAQRRRARVGGIRSRQLRCIIEHLLGELRAFSAARLPADLDG